MMLPPDMAALAAGGGDPAAAGGALPPDIMALLGGGGGGEPGFTPLPGEGEQAPPGGITDGAPGGGEEALTQAIDLLQVAIDAEADQEDVQVMLQCQTKLQQILAKNQADSDAALGGKVSPKAIRKQAGSVAGGAGGEY